MAAFTGGPVSKFSANCLQGVCVWVREKQANSTEMKTVSNVGFHWSFNLFLLMFYAFQFPHRLLDFIVFYYLGIPSYTCLSDTALLAYYPSHRPSLQHKFLSIFGSRNIYAEYHRCFQFFVHQPSMHS